MTKDIEFEIDLIHKIMNALSLTARVEKDQIFVQGIEDKTGSAIMDRVIARLEGAGFNIVFWSFGGEGAVIRFKLAVGN